MQRLWRYFGTLEGCALPWPGMMREQCCHACLGAGSCSSGWPGLAASSQALAGNPWRCSAEHPSAQDQHRSMQRLGWQGSTCRHPDMERSGSAGRVRWIAPLPGWAQPALLPFLVPQKCPWRPACPAPAMQTGFSVQMQTLAGFPLHNGNGSMTRLAPHLRRMRYAWESAGKEGARLVEVFGCVIDHLAGSILHLAQESSKALLGSRSSAPV